MSAIIFSIARLLNNIFIQLYLFYGLNDTNYKRKKFRKTLQLLVTNNGKIYYIKEVNCYDYGERCKL